MKSNNLGERDKQNKIRMESGTKCSKGENNLCKKRMEKTKNGHEGEEFMNFENWDCFCGDVYCDSDAFCCDV
jgi:hypothetical protein